MYQFISKTAALVAVITVFSCQSSTQPSSESGNEAQSATAAETKDSAQTPGAKVAKATDSAKSPDKVAAKPEGDIPAPADVAAPPADAQTTSSGLAYKHLTEGEGNSPKEWDAVKVHYSGWTTDGKMFDSSLRRNRPATFLLKSVIAGWTEGLQLMKIGGKTRFWIPEALAYQGKPGRPQGMLVFDVELLEIDERPAPPPAPEDVAAPPKDAQKTEKGVFYKVLTPGTGSDKPAATSTVSVHYTGWTTDGKMFDSSVTRGKPASFPLDRVIPGWTDGLQTMVVGQKSRFWIPQELAYQGRPGAPAGMLVFDVELLEIK